MYVWLHVNLWKSVLFSADIVFFNVCLMYCTSLIIIHRALRFASQNVTKYIDLFSISWNLDTTTRKVLLFRIILKKTMQIINKKYHRTLAVSSSSVPCILLLIRIVYVVKIGAVLPITYLTKFSSKKIFGREISRKNLTYFYTQVTKFAKILTIAWQTNFKTLWGPQDILGHYPTSSSTTIQIPISIPYP